MFPKPIYDGKLDLRKGHFTIRAHMALNQQQKQRATGYMFAILAIGIAGASIIGFAGGDRADIVLAFPVVAFLSYLSWKQLQPTSTEMIPTADERTRQIV